MLLSAKIVHFFCSVSVFVHNRGGWLWIFVWIVATDVNLISKFAVNK